MRARPGKQKKARGYMRYSNSEIGNLSKRHGNWLDRDLDRTFGKKPDPFRFRKFHPMNGETTDYNPKLKMPSKLKVRCGLTNPET